MDRSDSYIRNGVSAISDSSSLGILDLDNMSVLTGFSSISPTETNFRDSILKAAELCKLNSTAVIQSQMAEISSFNMPNVTTNALLNSRRFIPESFRSRCGSEINTTCEPPTKDNSTVSRFNLDSRYFRLSSDYEWRDSSDSIFPTAKNNSQNVLELKDTTKAAETRSDESPAPSFSNKLQRLEISSAMSFRDEEISARSTSFGQSTDQRTINSNSDATTWKLNSCSDSEETVKHSSEKLFASSTSANDLPWRNETAKRSSEKMFASSTSANDLPWRNETAKSSSEKLFASSTSASDLPWNNVTGFGNEQFSQVDFYVAGDASKILHEEEVEFEKQNEFMLPENTSEVNQARGFSTSREDFPDAGRTSLYNATALFSAKSDPLGSLWCNGNLQRPNFGLEVKSPERPSAGDTTNRRSSVCLSENEDYVADLVQDLSLDIPFKRKDDANLTLQTMTDKNLSQTLELPSTSDPSTSLNTSQRCDYQTSNAAYTTTRCNSASDDDYLRAQSFRLRKSHSAGNLSPEKYQTSGYAVRQASRPLYSRQCSASDVYASSCGYWPNQPIPGFNSVNPRVNPYNTPYFQLHQNAHYNIVSPVPGYSNFACPMPVPMPMPKVGYQEVFQQQLSECLRGPTELMGGYSCWGSQCVINVPVINPSNIVLKCNFSVVTIFLGSQRLSPDRIDLLLPSDSDIPPLTSTEFPVSFTAIDEGTIQIWIKAASESPCDNAVLGTFICHLMMHVEKPKIEAKPFDPQDGNSIQFAIACPDEETQIKFLRIVSHGKAAVPLIIYLQTEVVQDFEYIFPERHLNDLVHKSNHLIQVLSPTILLCQLLVQPISDTLILLPVTVLKKSNGIYRGYTNLIGTMTVSLQCPKKVDQDLYKIPLRAKIGICSAPLKSTSDASISQHHLQPTNSTMKDDYGRTVRPTRKGPFGNMESTRNSPPKVPTFTSAPPRLPVNINDPPERDFVKSTFFKSEF